MQIPAKTSEAVQNVIKTLHTEFSSHFSNHFREIDGKTADTSVTAGGVFGNNKTVDMLLNR